MSAPEETTPPRPSLIQIWRALNGHQKRTTLVAIGVFLTLLLPWYSVSQVTTGNANAVESTM
ncbi:MAG: hypothetical protein AB7G37_12150, partial [Solirubrobacteraceae bacterium]